MNLSSDEFIFAWDYAGSRKDEHFGMLADSPKDFISCAKVYSDAYDEDRPPSRMTKNGLEMQVFLLDLESEDCRKYFGLPLNCSWADKRNFKTPVSIKLENKRALPLSGNDSLKVSVSVQLHKDWTTNTFHRLGRLNSSNSISISEVLPFCLIRARSYSRKDLRGD